MLQRNRLRIGTNTRWNLVDRDTRVEGYAIDWRFRVGDLLKIPLVSALVSDHPIQHPIHVHGAGRLLVLARDGVAELNLVSKDTVLIGQGQVVNVLREITNRGVWITHCHDGGSSVCLLEGERRKLVSRYRPS